MSDPDRDRRTIKPTPKRIADFRKRGEIALSQDLTAVASMIGGAIVGLLFAKSSLARVEALTADTMRMLADAELATVWVLLAQSATTFVFMVLPTMVGALAGYLVGTFAQLGSPPALVAPKFELGKIASWGKLEQLFSPKEAGGRALKALAKLAFVGVALWIALSKEQAEFAERPAVDAGALLLRMISATARLAIWAGSALALLALLDYAWSKRELNAKMRMTPDEIRREMKESEGDPYIRRRRRQRMRELAKQRLAQDVKTADVVIVNPTEYAVAIRYRSKEDRAPKVVAKGRKGRAQRIRDLAREAGIPILPQPPLARLLYKLVREGQEIPAEVYQAVAEVLAYVYRLRRRAR
ncbi:EscU/YscU/HrcU family type III secretion system export apparatus switch protein [Myxococcota bacterium]|nr:EscU/YscU/HrcU family type III secretion system export apparatus switch protein [Myxococcota bacterium]